jgi:Rieske Fe-S protein
MVTAIGAAGAGTCVCGLGGGCATFSKVGATPAIAADAYVVEGKTLMVILGKTAPLANVGGSVKIVDARLPTPVIVARTGETEYAAVSLLCPHRGVEVEYRPADRQFRCASLGHSKFGTDGVLKKGLTKKSLSRYAAALDPADKNRLAVTL